MATRTVKLYGENTSNDATVTILWDGTSVASGALLDNPEDVYGYSIIAEWTFDDADSATIVDHAMSITVNSGEIRAGTLWFSTATGVNSNDDTLGHVNISTASDISGVGFWRPLNSHPYGNDDNDTALAERSNILINGAAPSANSGDTVPTGTADNPTWTGWFFSLSAGDELTCTARCPAEWVAA